MWVPIKLAGGKCRFVSGIEADKYEKVDDDWEIAETIASRFFVAEYEDGWE